MEVGQIWPGCGNWLTLKQLRRVKIAYIQPWQGIEPPQDAKIGIEIAPATPT